MSRTAASGPFDGAHDVGERDLLRRAGEARAAVGAPLRGDDAGAPEVGEDVVEEVAGDGLGLGDAVGLHQRAVGRGELEHRPHRVVGLRRDLHAAPDPSTLAPELRAIDGGVGVTRLSTRLSANTPVRTGSAAGGNHGIRYSRRAYAGQDGDRGGGRDRPQRAVLQVHRREQHDAQAVERGRRRPQPAHRPQVVAQLALGARRHGRRAARPSRRPAPSRATYRSPSSRRLSRPA